MSKKLRFVMKNCKNGEWGIFALKLN